MSQAVAANAAASMARANADVPAGERATGAVPSDPPTVGAPASDPPVEIARLATDRDAHDAPSDASPAVPDSEPMPAAAVPAREAVDARPRPVNPYLNNTPELRARRLARALVSDLVAYNPQKREEGLRDGTLRQLFRDEIRKSWDEYVEQVGPNVAESTPHFQDALNDVLAGGRRVF